MLPWDFVQGVIEIVRNIDVKTNESRQVKMKKKLS